MSSEIEPSTEGEVWEGSGQRYKLEKVVGNGAFGIVWRARDMAGGMVAIKKVVLDRRYHNRELEMMKQLDHRCVIKLRHFFEKPGRKREETYLHLVMDYLPETIRSVALQYHKQRMRFPTEHIRMYLVQALTALQYVHGLSICHRDLKPDNFLIDPSRLTLKLIDFGCAKVLVKGGQNVSYICSRYYRAPELLFGAVEYSLAVDMWSIGTILCELLLGHLPFQGQDSTQQHLIEIMKLLGTPSERELRAMRATVGPSDLPKLKPYPWERVFPQGTSSRAIDLTQRLLSYDPQLRLSAKQALRHPFFEGVQYLPDGTPSAPASGSGKGWDARLQELFDEYAHKRANYLSSEALPAFEKALEQELGKAGSTAELLNNGTLIPILKTELGKALRAANSGEAEAMRALGQRVRSTVMGTADGEAAPPEAAEAAELEKSLRSAKQEGSDGALEREVKELRAQLKGLQAKLAQATSDAPAPRTEAGTQTAAETAAAAAAPKTPANAVQGRRRSSSRGSSLAGDEDRPAVARHSSLVEPPSSAAGAAGGGQTAHGGNGYAPDYLGQVTPLGAIRDSRSLELPSS